MASAERLIQPIPLGWMMRGEWRAHPARVVVAALAIAIGVALGFAVHLVNQSALNEFGRALRSVNGDADLQIRSVSPLGFDEGLFPRLAAQSFLQAVSPVVELPARLGGQKVTLLGLDPLRAASVTPGLIGQAPPGSEANFLDEGAVYLSPQAMAISGARIGATVTITAAGQSADFILRGGLPGLAGDKALAVIDIAAAQWRFGQIGKLQRLDLKLRDGIDRENLRPRLQALLPPDATLMSEATEERRGDALSRAYRVNLDMLAMVALMTGGFLVFSAQSLSVARRQTQFALLRVLGLRRRALLGQIIIEGAMVGLIGGVIGILLGTLLAKAALSLLGGDLGGGYFGGVQPELVFPRLVALILLGLGILVAIGGSLLPAWQAGQAQPAVALKNIGDHHDPKRRPRASLGLMLIAAGTLAAFGPPLYGLPLLGYAAIALILAGGIALMPVLARAILAPLQSAPIRSVALDLAVKRLWGAPSQAAIALCGIVASTSLTIAMAVMVTSFRGSVDDWLTQLLPSDLYLRIENAEIGGLDPQQQQRLRALDGILRIEFRKSLPLRLEADRPEVALIIRPISAADPARSLPVLGPILRVPDGRMAVWVSEPLAWLDHLRPGDSLTLPFGDGERDFFIAGLWRDYGRQFGAIALDDSDYDLISHDPNRNEAAIDLAPGAESEKVMDALRAAIPASLREQTIIGEPREIRRVALKIFDRSFAVTYALEAIAVLVGLTGVAATLSAQTLARAREFGMLRHIGVRKNQIILMLIGEGALLGAVGILAGLALGLALSQILIHVVNPQSFHWTMQTRIPWLLFLVLAVALILASSLTSLLAGRRALSIEAVRAVREDW